MYVCTVHKYIDTLNTYLNFIQTQKTSVSALLTAKPKAVALTKCFHFLLFERHTSTRGFKRTKKKNKREVASERLNYDIDIVTQPTK